ncbi:MAG TPA: FlgD immunoglobulin-like domain containing protein [Candidatus Krumholzibacteria bacterium]|nr:FlgD immunoglobulin-like domain containing protein [Candidatus Krumholzibacteria bacterium]
MPSLARPLALLAVLLALTASPAAAQTVVTFDALGTGDSWGSLDGDVIGDVAFAEQGVEVTLTPFQVSGSPSFGSATIEPSFGPPRDFYVGNIARLALIGLNFDFVGTGSTTTFEYFDQGGAVNLRLNGTGSLIIAPDFASLRGPIGGGVTLDATEVLVPGGVKGTVTLTGDISELTIGGAELFIDEVRGGGPGADSGYCDLAITHESLALGTRYGDVAGMSPGDLMFVESDIEVFAAEFSSGSGGTAFGDAVVEQPSIAGFGSGNALTTLRLNGEYVFEEGPFVATQIRFVFLSRSGVENLGINGAEPYVGSLDKLPVAVAPGVEATVQATDTGSYVVGEVVLRGPVRTMVLGGEQLTVDEFCVERGLAAPGDCTHASDNESQPLGETWGRNGGQQPGDFVFDENEIGVRVEALEAGGSTSFDTITVEQARCSAASGQALGLSGAGVSWDLRRITPVDFARFAFCWCGGATTLTVNGTTVEAALPDIPADAFAPDALVDVTVTGVDGGCITGVVRILGDLESVGVAGEALQVDDFCAVAAGAATSADAPAPPRAIVGNHPNPFNPSTTIVFSLDREGPAELAVFDARGRHVTTLVDTALPAGRHEVRWDGRDTAGRVAASGVYFVRLSGADVGQAHRLVLLK